ncbi:hypothetical protein [Kineosporia sp. A_224]|uniref:hypothetical protein n=1 Tax=Kineosporia sp. A_224 TaxID=1962180 RepID=UPI000B4BC29B|nr:hypothetical protein [Kineosporia sp. A_224]
MTEVTHSNDGAVRRRATLLWRSRAWSSATDLRRRAGYLLAPFVLAFASSIGSALGVTWGLR